MDSTLQIILQIITAVSVFLTPIIMGLIGLRRIRLLKKDVVIIKDDVKVNTILTKQTAEKVDDNTKLTNEVNLKVETVKIQTDGLNDEIIKVTGLLGEAVGREVGREQQKNEEAKAKSDTPLEVKVINEPLKVVPIESEVKPDVPIEVKVINEPLKVEPIEPKDTPNGK